LTAFTAHLPNLQSLALMDTGLRRYGPARPTRDASYSVSVRQVAALLPRFFQTAPRGHRPCASLALRLHQTLGRGLSPPSCQTCSAHPEPWTPRTRPPLLGTRLERVSHSYHKASFVNRVLPMLPVDSVTYLPGRSQLAGERVQTGDIVNTSPGTLFTPGGCPGWKRMW
jgi:hypothetical protein